MKIGTRILANSPTLSHRMSEEFAKQKEKYEKDLSKSILQIRRDELKIQQLTADNQQLLKFIQDIQGEWGHSWHG